MRRILFDPYGLRPVFAISGIIFGVLLLSVAILVTVRTVDHAITTDKCEDKAVEWEKPTKWVDYNYFSYECLINVDGNWIPTNQYRN